MTTQKEVRKAFWQGMPDMWRKYRGTPQNLMPCDLRCEFVDFVDMLARDGHITEALAQRVTL